MANRYRVVALLLIGGLFWPHTIQAGTRAKPRKPTAQHLYQAKLEELCELVGVMSLEVAGARDRGTPVSAGLRQIREADLGEPSASLIRAMMLNVYRKPWRSLLEAQQQEELDCLLTVSQR